MKFVLPVTIIGGVILLIVIIAVVSHIFEKRRTEAFKKLAEDLSFDFFPSGRSDLLGELSCFHLFNIGHSKAMKNLMRGRAGGIELSIFDYRYVTGHGKHRHTWQQSVFVARAVGMDLPQFSMRPESIWHKIGNLFGLRDIDFESHPTFSSRYLLKGPNEDDIRDVFQPDVLDYFEQHLGLNVEGNGELLLYSTYKRLSPDGIRGFMADGFEILKLFHTSEATSDG